MLCASAWVVATCQSHQAPFAQCSRRLDGHDLPMNPIPCPAQSPMARIPAKLPPPAQNIQSWTSLVSPWIYFKCNVSFDRDKDSPGKAQTVVMHPDCPLLNCMDLACLALRHHPAKRSQVAEIALTWRTVSCLLPPAPRQAHDAAMLAQGTTAFRV